MNKRTVLVLSTTMMSIATAACAFCVAQSASAAEVSTSTISGVSTAKVTTPPPIENISSQETNSSETNRIKSSDPSDKDNVRPETNSKPNSNTKTESKLEAKSDVKSDAKLDVKSDSKLDTKTNVNTVVKTTAKSNVDSAVNTDTKDESNIDSKSKVSENSVSPTIFNQALFASGKPNPNHQQQQEKTELKVSLCWETMNDDNKNAFVTENSDFGQLNFKSWDFGSKLDSSRQDVKDAFKKIQFQIKDITDNKVVATTAGTYDPKTATYATKSLGSYDSSHTYIVSVVNSTVPSPYYVTYNNVSTNEGEAFDPDATYFTWTPSKGSDKKSQNKYFRLNVLEIVYAKDENVASKCFSYSQPQNANKEYQSDGDWQFKYNSDNIFERIRVKDNAIQFPTTNPTKVGYKFVGWQFYVAQKSNGYPYTSYDRMDDDDKKIIKSTTVAYWDFGTKPFIDYPYFFAVIRDSKGVNTFGSKLGTQYCSTNHTFVVFPKWIKEAGHTVTFINEGSEYAKVKVQAGESISAQSMPTKPSKYGYSFMMWNTSSDGKGSEFLAGTKVDSDMTVYAIYDLNAVVLNQVPILKLQDKTITEGEQLDLKTLVVSAQDPEDGDITSKVKLTDDGGFDNTKVGSYKITFSVTDNGGATATASATVTVTKKPTPPTPPEPEPTPVPEPEPEQELEPSPAPDQPDQPEQPKQQKHPEAKHSAKHLPQTGSTTTTIFASAIVSLFAGLAGLAESFAATRKRRN
ncbi:InlB B-repeat-containing protein [Gardnerella sp. DNF00983]|uniref:InlB B-repeat-containing protein n=1 Tax=Gardnerella sp. DNF00983 TaxID=2749056 RepID=UPI003BAB5B2E